MNKISMAIIGSGSRGISLLERIVTLYSEYCQNEKIDVWMIDKNAPGYGIHDPGQPYYYLANTVACQITMFGDDTVKDAGKVHRGPDFWRWARAHGYKKSEQGFSKYRQGENISPNDYLPRAMLGEYLNYVYKSIVKNLPENITVNEVHACALQVSTFSNDKIKIKLNDKIKIKADYLFFATGHGENIPTEDDVNIQKFVSEYSSKNILLHYISHPYNSAEYTKIVRTSKILIEGIGLTTYDIIARLTTGRGGNFTHSGNRLIYHPSGNEPNISIYSRQALPAGSRGVNQKGPSGQYVPHFFTRDAIDSLRNKAPDGKIDFVADLLPLLTTEMSYVFSCVQHHHWQKAQGYQTSPDERDAISQLFYPHRNLSFPNIGSYREWFKTFLETDVAEAEKGNISGALKAAADVIRDTRDILRYAVDYGGLTPQSHRKFLSEFCSIFNRIAVGPPLRRNQELLALLDSGVVTLAGGPGARLVCQQESGHFALHTRFLHEDSVILADILIKARIPSFSPCSDSSLLYHNLMAEGLVRPYDNAGFLAGGIDIDRQHHVISRKNICQKNIYALGNPVEGPNFYTYILPRPAVNSTALRDAALCVIDMYQNIRKHSSC